MKKLIFGIIVVAVALGARCGGGFSTDSGNAAELAPAIFGASSDSSAR